jgi:hypothetical protein
LEEARGTLQYVLKRAPENLAAIRGLAEIHDRLGEAPERADDDSRGDSRGIWVHATGGPGPRSRTVECL